MFVRAIFSVPTGLLQYATPFAIAFGSDLLRTIINRLAQESFDGQSVWIVSAAPW
jgi:hypothetical protein